MIGAAKAGVALKMLAKELGIEIGWDAAKRILREKGPGAAAEIGRAIHKRQELIKKWRSLVIGLIRYDLARFDQESSDALLLNHENRVNWRTSDQGYSRTDENRFIEAYALEVMDHLGKWINPSDLKGVRETFNLDHLLNVWRDRARGGQEVIDRDVEAIIHNYYEMWAKRIGIDVPLQAIKKVEEGATKVDSMASEGARHINAAADAIRRARP